MEVSILAAGRHDLLIVGAGPAGLAAADRARHHGISYLVLERARHLADTVHCYQKRKHVMAEPGPVPLRSDLPFAAGSREALLEAWEAFAAERGLAVRLGEEVKRIERHGGANGGGGFTVTTTAGTAYEAEKVVLALGTQGNPRPLGAPGEEQPHVSHRLVDPAEVEGESVVVVGAGDSALEVALALADRNRVALIVRKPEIVRAKESLEREILSRQAAGEITIHFSSGVQRVLERECDISGAEDDLRVPADRIYLMLGAVPPRRWLEGIGVEFAGEGREARPVLDARFESSVPGLHLIGSVTGRDLIKLGINQGYEVVEHVLGNDVEPADEPVLRERLPWWDGTVRERIARLAEEIPLFGAADEGDLRELFLSVKVRDVPPGEVIVRQNDYTDSLLAVASGTVEVLVRPERSDQDRLVALLSAGNFFGEMSLLSNRRRNATVASRGCRVIEVPRKAMLKLLAVSPPVKAMVDRAFLLRAIQGYLFPGVAEDLIWALVAKAEVVSVDKEKLLFEEGAPADALYLIRSGMVKVSKRSGDREIILSYLTAGNFFGEVALLPDARRTAAVATIFPTELVRLARADIEAFLDRHPEVGSDLLAKLEERRLATLRAEATPGAGRILTDLIREEVVIATDALIIDDYKCVRCGNCVAACEGVHEDGQARLSLTGIHFANILAPNSCWQCENPLCMLDCPPDALVRDSRGEIYIRDNCIGCGNCEANCPYDNIFMVHPTPRKSPWDWVKSLIKGGGEESGRTVAVKCDLCRTLSTGPACVSSCPTGAAIRLTPDQYEETIGSLVALGRRSV